LKPRYFAAAENLLCGIIGTELGMKEIKVPVWWAAVSRFVMMFTGLLAYDAVSKLLAMGQSIREMLIRSVSVAVLVGTLGYFTDSSRKETSKDDRAHG
jgi:hypothetical protein